VAFLGIPTDVIQVAYSSLNDLSTRVRELSALVECMKSLQKKHGVIITSDYEDEEKHYGCKVGYVPLYKWLCHEKI
jgi:predicted AAA+ superfamily ATPase